MKIKDNISIVLLIIAMLVGLSLLLYPTVSNAWNQKHQSQAIAEYIEDVENIDSESYERILNDAKAYNEKLADGMQTPHLSEEGKKNYNSVLNIGSKGIMGYLNVPKIDCYLPIYHGSDIEIMQVGIGHIEWTSLPVGGSSSHCVLTGHRGMPGTKLFTNLDKMEIGDTFTIIVLDEIYVYKVDDISVVLPEKIDTLTVRNGKDYCTLMTCTPYGVNSHRLLVRGVRIEANDPDRITSDARTINPMIVSSLIIAPVVFISLAIRVIKDKKAKKPKIVKNNDNSQ